ncbi:MAG: acyl-CoA dehydrogenase family protein [Candidatus Neomarinimicrobiota bacterium]
MDFHYTEEQELIKKTAREFAEKHLAPGVIERDYKSEPPYEQVKMMGDLGFMGMMVPEEWNGPGVNMVSYILAVTEISRVDASAGVIMSVNNSLVCQIFLDWANDNQKEKYLTKLATGENIGAFSLSEPQSGSDASNMRSFAHKDGSDYILNGTKNWVTNGISADTIMVFIPTKKGVGYKGISVFIVEKGTPGFSRGKEEDKLGIRGSETCELYFDDCRVPAENMVGDLGQGFRIAMASLDKSVEYANERKQFGKRIAEFGAIQSKIARMATSIDAARFLILNAARKKDELVPFSREAAMAKLFASQVAVDASRDCVQIHGGYGYMQEYGVERLMRDAKITQIYEGTSEIQELIIARSILGE